MKVVIPNFSPPDSFVDNVSHTLNQMGHEVLHMGYLSNSRINSRLLNTGKILIKKALNKHLSKQEKWLKKAISKFKPHLVLSLTQSLTEETLKLLSDKGIRTVTWWGDTAANMSGKGLLVDGWDIIYIKDKFAANKLKSVGLNAHHLVEAMNPDWHKPIAKQANYEVVLAGSFYEHRHYLTKKLISDNIAVGLYGGSLPLWVDSKIKRAHSGKFVTRLDKSKVFGEGLAVLNSTSMREFDSMNCRAFEIAGTGGLQLMEYRSAIEECFEPGKEILVYHSYDELKELIERAKKEPAEMQKIRNAAHKRALSEHTYRHRLTRILNDIKQL